jgi:multidrug efflux pump subunit AcrB
MNGKPAVMMTGFRQPGANIIDTVERVKAVLPQLQASIPASAHLQVMLIAPRLFGHPCTTWSPP